MQVESNRKAARHPLPMGLGLEPYSGGMAVAFPLPPALPGCLCHKQDSGTEMSWSLSSVSLASHHITVQQVAAYVANNIMLEHHGFHSPIKEGAEPRPSSSPPPRGSVEQPGQRPVSRGAVHRLLLHFKSRSSGWRFEEEQTLHSRAVQFVDYAGSCPGLLVTLLAVLIDESLWSRFGPAPAVSVITTAQYGNKPPRGTILPHGDRYPQYGAYRPALAQFTAAMATRPAPSPTPAPARSRRGRPWPSNGPEYPHGKRPATGHIRRLPRIPRMWYFWGRCVYQYR